MQHVEHKPEADNPNANMQICQNLRTTYSLTRLRDGDVVGELMNTTYSEANATKGIRTYLMFWF